MKPEYGREAFVCPHCGVFAEQLWFRFIARPRHVEHEAMDGPTDVFCAVCRTCKGQSIWLTVGEDVAGVEPIGAMCYPSSADPGPEGHADMPGEVREDYDEARSILMRSPRGACALLRLATEKLVANHLDASGGNLNSRIGDLVERGLAPVIQQSLDVLRVWGNEAVHPGELDVRDDRETAIALLDLLNMIVDDRIARPRQVQSLYDRLPQSKRDGIDARDRARLPEGTGEA